MAASCRLTVRMKPGAKRNCIAPGPAGGLVVSVTSPPVDGKANEHLVKLLSKTLRLSKSSFEIIVGQSGRDKVIAIDGMTAEEVFAKLSDSE